MIITYNALACFIGNQFKINNGNKVKTMERLSSGYRINRAADDAAGLAISEKLRGQVRGLNRAAENVLDGISLCQTADGALGEVQNILERIRELSVQAANDVYIEEDREKINDEIKQLKKEINRVSIDTEYNKKKIFTVPYTIDFSEDFKVVKIFDANNGDPTDPDSYGGIILSTLSGGEDTRISWKDIAPNMVTKDPLTGETIFQKGTYTYDTGIYTLNIECKEGSTPPQIKVSFPVTADENGIYVAGEHIDWSHVFNEDDECILNHIGEEGLYYFKIGNGMGSFYAPEFDSIHDLAECINAANSRYNRKYINEYSGYDFDQAVDIMNSEGSTMRVNRALYDLLIKHQDLDMRLKADKSGIWIVSVNADGTDGAELQDSRKTWDDMGIRSWNSLGDISDKKLYEYNYSANGYHIKFNFTLLDETSIESVIDGINNASIRDTLIQTNNDIDMKFAAGNGLTDGKITHKDVNVNIYDEAALGRNFDISSEVFSNGTLTYDKATDEFVLTFPNKNTGDPELAFRSNYRTNKKTLKDKALAYENYLLSRRVQQLLSGSGSPSYPTLDDIIGNDHIREENTLLDSRTMNTTQMMSGNYYAVGMDFSGLGVDYQLYDLLGTGFNSTCATCDNHYSVIFVWDGTENKTNRGYGYSMINDGQDNYTLMVDIKSMMGKITSGAEFASALVDIMNAAAFDFHFQQYAADGSTLYVCDNRHNALGSFDTEPYEIGSCAIDVQMSDKTNGSGEFNLKYTYDLKHDLNPFANLVEDLNGEFVEDGKGGFKKFNYYDYYGVGGQLKPGVTLPKRYNINVSGRVSSWEDYYDQVMENVAKQTNFDMLSTDYDYVNYTANENPNQATVSEFDFYIEDERGFWIQAGANDGQGILLDWDGFTTYTLTIGDKNTLTRDNASELLKCSDTAISRISSLRSLFGAYTNRLEFAYANDKNAAENLQNSESKLRDADMAEEITIFSKQNILTQASLSLLTQANQLSQGVLRLLNLPS